MRAPTAIATLAQIPNDYGRWLIHGPQGSGKTTLASTVAELGQTLFIDLIGERGVRSFMGATYAGNIDVARPTSVTDLDDVYWWLRAGDHPYAAVVLDSISSVQKLTMRMLLGHSETAVREIKQGTAPATMQTWGQSLDIMSDLAVFWHSLASAELDHPMHVVMVAQTRFDEETQTYRPDVQKGAMTPTLATPDYVLYTDVEPDLDSTEDDAVRHIVRFGANPTYRTKARVPADLRGKINPVLGRTSTITLGRLSRVLRLGGVPAATTPPPQTAPAPAAGDTEQGAEQ